MRYIFIVIALFSLSSFSLASGDAVWRSSHTATIDTAQTPCPVTKKALLHAVCINNADGAGVITLYDARASATNSFAVIRATAAVAAGCSAYDVQLSSGFTYSKTAVDDVTFTFGCY
jgi:hypothetical protein